MHYYRVSLVLVQFIHIQFIHLYSISLSLFQFIHTQFLYSYVANLILVQSTHRAIVLYFDFTALHVFHFCTLLSIKSVYTNRILFHHLFSYVALWHPFLMSFRKLHLYFGIHRLRPGL